MKVFYSVFTYEISKATDTPLKGKPLTPIEAKKIFESKETGEKFLSNRKRRTPNIEP